MLVYGAAAATGLLADRLLGWSASSWWGLAAGSLVTWWLLRCRQSLLAGLVLVVALSATFAAWHHARWFLFAPDELARFAAPDGHARPVCLEAILVEPPALVPAEPRDALSSIPRGDRSQAEIRVLRVRSGREWTPASGRAEVTVNGHWLGAQAGDHVRLYGYLRRISPPRNPGQRDFAAHARAERRLCRVTCAYPDCVLRLGTFSSQRVRHGVRAMRGYCTKVLWRYLPVAQRDLAAALLLGDRERLTRQRTEMFVQTGTVHLLAISGLHVGLLAGMLLVVARGRVLPVRTAVSLVMGVILVYALLTGARAPVMRAVILVHVLCLGWLLRRRPAAFNSWALAALLVLVWNPADLYRPGAQLSFLAVGTLIWCAPFLVVAPPEDPLQRLIWRTRPWYRRLARGLRTRLRQLLIASGAVWLATAPLVMHHFHLVSPIGIVLSVVLWIPVAFALLSGFAVLTLHAVSHVLAQLFAFVCGASLASLAWIVQVAQQVPGGWWWVAGPSALWTACFYATLPAMAWLHPPRRWWWAWGLTWLALPWGWEWAHSPNSALRCTFLSVGHGTCVVLQLPGGRTMLYDCGRLGTPDPAVDLVSRFLWSRRIRRLDAVILSHADADHFNALPGLLQRFEVAQVMVGPNMFQQAAGPLAVLRDALHQARIPVRTIAAGDCLQVDPGVRLLVLHPPEGGLAASTDNANSLVLAIWYRGTLILLPGDLEKDGMQLLLDQPSLDCDVVMAPHHGSPHSRPMEFVDWAQCQTVVISGGSDPSSEYTAGQLRRAGCRVLHTDRHGAVEVYVDAKGLHLDAFVPQRPAAATNSGAERPPWAEAVVP